MLFNSFEYIIFFLPLTVLVFSLTRKHNFTLAKTWLVLASLFFYGWWNPKYLLLMIPLLCFNFVVGYHLAKTKSKLLLGFGISMNLLVLGYFKYANFLVDNINDLSGNNFYLEKIILPLGISFFTFQKIAYLVDSYKGEVKEHNFLNFSLFVLFFPQLIAGPIVHHKQIIPQFRDYKMSEFSKNLVLGLTIFLVGLFKKVVIADNMSLYAEPSFSLAATGVNLSFFEAWGAAIAYTLQLYFDFSGYTDMAIGSAMLFGILLPINFNSPYKSLSLIDFWRRWHITLSSFLRDYIYIPLGGSRKKGFFHYRNLLIVMFLAGIWHGAGWTFVLWGSLHGFFLCINHLWRKVLHNKLESINRYKLYKLFCWFLTFGFIVVTWVIFRAENISTALSIIQSMFGSEGITLPAKMIKHFPDADPQIFIGMMYNNITNWRGSLNYFIILVLCTVILPNTNQLFIEKTSRLAWRPNVAWGFLMAVCAVGSYVSMMFMEKSEFLYFDF